MGIATRHIERCGTDVGSGHLRGGQRQGDADGDRSATRTQIQHASIGRTSRQRLQSRFHQHFGIRARNQHVGRQGEHMPHELAFAH